MAVRCFVMRHFSTRHGLFMTRTFTTATKAFRMLGRSLRAEQGQTLILALGIVTVLMVSTAATIEIVRAGQVSSSRERQASRALAIAEAGLDKALYAVGTTDPTQRTGCGRDDLEHLLLLRRRQRHLLGDEERRRQLDRRRACHVCRRPGDPARRGDGGSSHDNDRERGLAGLRLRLRHGRPGAGLHGHLDDRQFDRQRRSGDGPGLCRRFPLCLRRRLAADRQPGRRLEDLALRRRQVPDLRQLLAHRLVRRGEPAREGDGRRGLPGLLPRLEERDLQHPRQSDERHGLRDLGRLL